MRQVYWLVIKRCTKDGCRCKKRSDESNYGEQQQLEGVMLIDEAEHLSRGARARQGKGKRTGRNARHETSPAFCQCKMTLGGRQVARQVCRGPD